MDLMLRVSATSLSLKDNDGISPTPTSREAEAEEFSALTSIVSPLLTANAPRLTTENPAPEGRARRAQGRGMRKGVCSFPRCP